MTSEVPVRVAVVDDQPAVRRVFADLLETHGFEVVAEASNGHEAVLLCIRLQPDAVLMDARMPVLDGIRATRRIKETEPATRVIVMTAYEQDELSEASFAAGADAFALKGLSGAELARLVWETVNGGPRARSPLLQEVTS